MEKDTPIINILTYKLPFDTANQIYNEYQSRLKEAKFLIEKYKTYKVLKNNLKTVELLLALSIFHKRVITNLDAAVKFHNTVDKYSNANTTIKIGSYDLTGQERNKILAVTINYNKLIEKFSINPAILEYQETNELLKNIINLKKYFNSIRERKNAEKSLSKKIRKSNGNQKGNIEDDIPF